MEVARSSCRNALKESGHALDYGDMEMGDHPYYILIQKQIFVK